MNSTLLPILAAGLLLPAANPSQAPDDPRAILEKAVRAMGGEERLVHVNAGRQRLKGSLAEAGGVTFEAETFWHLPGRLKIVTHASGDEQPFGRCFTLVGDRGWIIVNGQSYDMPAELLAEVKKAGYADRVNSLMPLLKDKSFTLAMLPEIQVQDRPAVGVKISAKGQQDIRLYFDRGTGLLVKAGRMVKAPGEQKEVPQDLTFLDYREPSPVAEEEELLRTVGVGTDNPALIDWFRKQTLAPAERQELQDLVRQLGDDEFAVREKATAAVIARGPAVIPWLRRVARDADAELARRADHCLKRIEERAGTAATAAAVRLLAFRKPAGAVEVLLAYLPDAPDEGVAREVQAALIELALANGKPHPALERALEEKNPLVRAAAQAALGRDGGAFDRSFGRRVYLTGVKVPMKLVAERDGKKVMEWEVLRVQYFHRLEDRVFARPGDNPEK